MGIPKLNRELMKRCKTLDPRAIDELRGKKIAIDINNYLYRIVDGDILENFKTFSELLNNMEIEPIYVFDGKPPCHKRKIIAGRKQKMMALKNKLAILEKIQKSKDTVTNIQDNTIQDFNIQKTIKHLKKRTVKVTNANFMSIRRYMDENDCTYFVSGNDKEADDICISLMESGAVDMILSDDMDFVGKGCKMVIRQFNQEKRECCYYKFSDILKDMNMTKDEFYQMCEDFNK